MKIVLTHTEEFPFDCYEGNLANGEYAGAYLVKFKDCAHPELMFVTESQEFEDCCALENGSNIVERDQRRREADSLTCGTTAIHHGCRRSPDPSSSFLKLV